MTGEKPCIIVGLGNPGPRYAETRHNIGFMVADALASAAGPAAWRRETRSVTCRTVIEGRQVVLAKPLTYMNLSGLAVEDLRRGCQASPEDFVILLDDLNLPFGRIRIRTRGSAGGHHGLESVIRSLGSDEFTRVRLGVGETDMPEEKADFVLSGFPSSANEELNEMIRKAGEAVRTILGMGVDRAMSVYNA